jgi:hypothetical protein
MAEPNDPGELMAIPMPAPVPRVALQYVKIRFLT